MMHSLIFFYFASYIHVDNLFQEAAVQQITKQLKLIVSFLALSQCTCTNQIRNYNKKKLDSSLHVCKEYIIFKNNEALLCENSPTQTKICIC